MSRILVLTLALIFTSCDKDNDPSGDKACYSFDIRQCQTDVFADAVSENDSVEKRENDLMEWIENQGVSVDEIKLVTNFHDAVCEACHVCPQGDRYYIKVSLESSLDSLDLLNLEETDCLEHFGE